MQDTIRDKVLAALRWTAVARFTAQFLTWAITLVVIRLLEPSDYGLMAMGEVVFGLLLMLSTTGLGSALIQAKDLSERQTRQMFGILILVNGAFFAAQFFAAPLVAAYFGEPRVTRLVRVLALGFLIIPFLTIPSSLLSRDIDFKRKSIVELVAATVAAVTTLVLASMSFGVWALVVGRLLNLAVKAIGLNLVRPFLRLPSFALAGTRKLIQFGGLVTGSTILWYLYGQAGVIIAGRFLDLEALGYYTVALHVASLLMVKVMPLLNQVALPAYSRVQHDRSAVAYYFLKVVRVVAIVSFPAYLGLACVAPEFTRLVLGPKYEAAIIPLILLSWTMPLRTANYLFSPALYGLGRPGITLWNTVIAIIVVPVALLVGVQWGVVGLCVGWLVGFPIVYLVSLHRCAPVIGTTRSAVARSLWPGTAAALVMYASILLLKLLPIEQLGRVFELVALILLGVSVYVGVLWTFHRERALEVLRFARR